MSLKGKATSAPGTLFKNAATAPMVYFDGVPLFGIGSGNIEIELAARVLMPRADGTVGADAVCVAHLRCSPQAAAALADAATKALEMFAKQQAAPKSELLQS